MITGVQRLLKISVSVCVVAAFLVCMLAFPLHRAVAEMTASRVLAASTASCADAYVASDTAGISGVSWNKTIYVPKEATLTIEDSTINGDIYVMGTLKTTGTVKVNGTINCLHYGTMMSAGNYDYGYVTNSGKLNASSVNVTDRWLSTQFPTLTHGDRTTSTHNEKAATCTTPGSYELVEKCSLCDTVLVDEVIATEPLGHDFASTGIVKAPTCTNAGLERFICSRCGEEDARELPAKGHTASAAAREDVVDATCVSAGSYHLVTRCATCKEVLTSSTVSQEKLGHVWQPWRVVKKSTTTTKGESKRACSRCGTAESKTLPLLEKAKQTVKVRVVTKAYRGKKYVKSGKLAKNQSFSIGASAKGKTNCRKTAGSARIRVDSTGKVTVKKGLKRGTYKVGVTVRAAETSLYKSCVKKIAVTVRIG